MSPFSACLIHCAWENGDGTFSIHAIARGGHHTFVAEERVAVPLMESMAGTEMGAMLMDLEVDGARIVATNRTPRAPFPLSS